MYVNLGQELTESVLYYIDRRNFLLVLHRGRNVENPIPIPPSGAQAATPELLPRLCFALLPPPPPSSR